MIASTNLGNLAHEGVCRVASRRWAVAFGSVVARSLKQHNVSPERRFTQFLVREQ